MGVIISVAEATRVRLQEWDVLSKEQRGMSTPMPVKEYLRKEIAKRSASHMFKRFSEIINTWPDVDRKNN